MPQSSGDQCAARNPPFYPTVFEESANAELFGTGALLKRAAKLLPTP